MALVLASGGGYAQHFFFAKDGRAVFASAGYDHNQIIATVDFLVSTPSTCGVVSLFLLGIIVFAWDADALSLKRGARYLCQAGQIREGVKVVALMRDMETRKESGLTLKLSEVHLFRFGLRILVYLVICDFGSVPRRGIFSPRETLPEVQPTLSLSGTFT